MPRTLIIDNLRAAVTRADWYDPELNAKVESTEFIEYFLDPVLGSTGSSSKFDVSRG